MSRPYTANALRPPEEPITKNSNHVPRSLIAVALAALLLAPLATAATAPPRSTSVADPAGDQAPGNRWDAYPGLRSSTDLRRAVVASKAGTLRITWTYAATPGHPRAHWDSGLSASIGTKQITFAAWKHAGRTYISVSTGLGNDSRFYCAGRGTVSLNRTAHQATLRVPVSCLPRGNVLRGPYAYGGVPVLKPSGVLAGYVGSDSTVQARAVTIR